MKTPKTKIQTPTPAAAAEPWELNLATGAPGINFIDAAIAGLHRQIAVRQEAVAALHAVNGWQPPLPPLAPEVPTAAVDKGERERGGKGAGEKRKYTKRGTRPTATATSSPASSTAVSVAATLDKPSTVARAIKVLLRGEAVGAKFTKELLRGNLEADADYKKLLETDTGEKSFENALNNWSNTDKLTKTGDRGEYTYTITAAGKEWFNA